jgi:hypothetical protein
MMRSSAHHLDQYIMAALYPTYQNAHKSFREMVYDSSVITEDIIRDFLNRGDFKMQSMLLCLYY